MLLKVCAWSLESPDLQFPSLTLLKSQNQVMQPDVFGTDFSWMNNVFICEAPLSLLCVTALLKISPCITACSRSPWQLCAKCPGRPGSRGDPPLSLPPRCDWPGCWGCGATPLQVERPGHRIRWASGPEGEMTNGSLWWSYFLCFVNLFVVCF